MPNYNSNRIKAMAVQNEGDELTAAFWFCTGENEGWLRFSTTSTEVDAYSIDNLRQVLVMIEDAVDAGTLQFSNEIPEMLGAASAPEA